LFNDCSNLSTLYIQNNTDNNNGDKVASSPPLTNIYISPTIDDTISNMQNYLKNVYLLK
jgi:hypothetical protein